MNHKHKHHQHGLHSSVWPFSRMLILIGVAIAVAVVTWILTTVEQNRDHQVRVVKTAQQTLNESAASGDYQKAYESLKETEGQVTSKSQKIELYNSLAAAASNAGKIGEALHYYNLKYEIDPSQKGQDGYLVGSLYERQNDRERALVSYKAYQAYLEKQPRNEYINQKLAGIKETIASVEASN